MIPTREEIDKADDEGMHSLCLELCERLVRERPDDASLLYLYAGKLTKFARYEEAEKALLHAEKVAAPSSSNGYCPNAAVSMKKWESFDGQKRCN